MSRKDKFSRSARERVNRHTKEQGAIHEEESLPTGDQALPPRRKKFPSSANKLSRWYYHLIFVLFLGLVAFLFWYGTTFSHRE